MGDRELENYLQQSLRQGTALERERDKKSARLQETIDLCTGIMREQRSAHKVTSLLVTFTCICAIYFILFLTLHLGYLCALSPPTDSFRLSSRYSLHLESYHMHS